VVVEHRLAGLGQLGVGQARYLGRQKTRFQLLVLATIANRRWTWNWKRRQSAAETAAGASDPGATTPVGATARAQTGTAAGGSPDFAAPGGRNAAARVWSRWLSLTHPLTSALAVGASSAAFRPHF
jgi:hypothetical protein